MSRQQPQDKASMPFRARLAADPVSVTSLPPPLYHHPVVAVSLVLTVACLAQIAVWLVSPRLLPPPGAVPGSRAVTHGYLYETIQGAMAAVVPQDRLQSALFITCLGAALLSSMAWYAVARFGIGPAWGLWTALLWVVHPSFAFLAQRTGPLALLILLTPVSLALLLRWRTSRRRIAAFLAGLVLGLSTLISFHGILLLPPILIAMLWARMRRRARLRGAVVLLLGFGLALGAGLFAFRPPLNLRGVTARLDQGLWVAASNGDSSVAQAAQRQLAEHPGARGQSFGRFLVAQFTNAPVLTLDWLGRRLGSCTYATINGTLQRPLHSFQLAFLFPALWGAIVALRHRPWRWTVILSGCYVAVFWLTAGLAEPLARNLIPVGGIPLLFALVGLADLYERLFGRRLAAAEASGPVAAQGRPGYNPR